MIPWVKPTQWESCPSPPIIFLPRTSCSEKIICFSLSLDRGTWGLGLSDGVVAEQLHYPPHSIYTITVETQGLKTPTGERFLLFWRTRKPHWKIPSTAFPDVNQLQHSQMLPATVFPDVIRWDVNSHSVRNSLFEHVDLHVSYKTCSSHGFTNEGIEFRIG